MLCLGGVSERGICELLTVQEIVPGAEETGHGDKRLEEWYDAYRRRQADEEDDIAVLLMAMIS